MSTTPTDRQNENAQADVSVSKIGTPDRGPVLQPLGDKQLSLDGVSPVTSPGNVGSGGGDGEVDAGGVAPISLRVPTTTSPKISGTSDPVKISPQPTTAEGLAAKISESLERSTGSTTASTMFRQLVVAIQFPGSAVIYPTKVLISSLICQSMLDAQLKGAAYACQQFGEAAENAIASVRPQLVVAAPPELKTVLEPKASTDTVLSGAQGTDKAETFIGPPSPTAAQIAAQAAADAAKITKENAIVYDKYGQAIPGFIFGVAKGAVETMAAPISSVAVLKAKEGIEFVATAIGEVVTNGVELAVDAVAQFFQDFTNPQPDAVDAGVNQSSNSGSNDGNASSNSSDDDGSSSDAGGGGATGQSVEGDQGDQGGTSSGSGGGGTADGQGGDQNPGDGIGGDGNSSSGDGTDGDGDGTGDGTGDTGGEGSGGDDGSGGGGGDAGSGGGDGGEGGDGGGGSGDGGGESGDGGDDGGGTSGDGGAEKVNKVGP